MIQANGQREHHLPKSSDTTSRKKSGILFDSGMARGEADRMAVQHFNGER